ncbi:mce related protein [bacterium BMS3Abin05]|nr:mce related protein [bacterium BMS3Abin05]GBE27148.1 mce related protein [bacterium BMS3Bbin03]HDZ11596.1 MCE family protein [Bacteroidota bacterium]
MNKTFSDELFIGIGMTLATLVVIVGVLYLSNSNFLKKGLGIDVIVPEAGDLTTGDDVFMRGVKIGSVKNISIQNNSVDVHLKIEKIKKIPSDSKFVIEQKNILGEKMVTIQPGISKKYLPDMAVVPGTIDKGLSKITGKAELLSDQILELVRQTQRLLDNQNDESIPYGMKHLNQSIREVESVLAQNKDQIHTIIENLKAGSQQFKALHDTSKQSVARVLQNLEENTTKLSQLLTRTHRAAESLDSILTFINKGQGTLGKLVKEDSLYNHMNQTFKNLDWILGEVKKNPDKFFNVKVKLF